MSTTKLQTKISVVLFAAATLASTSCGELARTGRSPVVLVIDAVEASAGADGTFAGFLLSDVITKGGTVNDSGRATFRLLAKNPGTTSVPLGPSNLNSVTVERYRVRYIRADGRNTPGVDVPWGFDGGVTVTVPPNGTAQAVFDLVRHVNKAEPPLSNLRGIGGGQFINAIVQVTFWGHDQAGNEVEASGTVNVNFADFADEE
jgi:hypothetical protein